MGSRANSSQADMHGKMMKYDQAVTKLNQRRLQSAYFPIVHAFKDASLSFTDDNDKSSPLLIQLLLWSQLLDWD
jgi:hypothetical protein